MHNPLLPPGMTPEQLTELLGDAAKKLKGLKITHADGSTTTTEEYVARMDDELGTSLSKKSEK